MPQINLLPWREELRTRKQKEFGIVAGVAALIMVVIIAAVHFQFNAMMDFQQSRNKYLEDQIAGLDKKIDQIKQLEEKKKNLLARMEIIQQLQSSRPEVVHLFDELVLTLPDGVYFENLKQKARSLTLEGFAQSNARVSSLMRQLDSSEWLTNPALVEIKAVKMGGPNVPANDLARLSNFKLVVQQPKPTKDGEDEES